MIPEIDLSGALRGDPEALRTVHGQINDALRDIGFFTIVGHGLSAAEIATVAQGAKAFFDQPAETKERFLSTRGTISRGYVGLGKENLGRTLGTDATDIKEQLAFGRFNVPDTPYYRQPFAASAFEPNVVPDIPLGFAEATRSYYAHMEWLTAKLLELLAGALDLKADFFVPFFDKHTSVMRVIHYPDQSGMTVGTRQTRSGAHTDYGALTILLAEKAPGGLQVKLRNGGWIDIAPKPGSFIINIGDLMAMWTNDYWISNLHRVANPESGLAGPTRRLSIAYFAHANYDARIECIPTCRGEAGARHAPVLAGEHRAAKVRMSQVA